MAAYTAYFDAGGHPADRKTLFVSGFVSTAKKWRAFDQAWTRLLKGEGVRCPFHMTHFVLGRGAFDRWKDDDARRVATVKRLTRVITTHVHKSVSTGVTIADFRRVEKDFDFAAAHLTPYSLCATESIVRAERWRMFYTPRKNARIAFVLEAGDYDQHTLQLRLQAIDCSAPGFLDSGLTVFASMLPRPTRRSHVAPERGFDSGTSLASTARCTSA